MKRSLLGYLTVLAAAVVATAASAQDFPQKPVRIIVAYGPGNGLDIMARSLADILTTEWGQKVFVENRPGGSSILAMNEVKASRPDGYTLMAGDVGNLIVNPSMYKKLPYDPQKDLVSITDLLWTPWVFFVSKKTGINSMQELIDRAKANPGKLTYGSTGLGAPNFLVAESLKLRFGIDLLHVPYKDSNQLHGAAANEEISLMISSWATAQPVIAHMVPLAVAASERQPLFPQVPTVNEATGTKDFVLAAWASLMGISGTPGPILQKIGTDSIKAIRSEAFQKRAVAAGMTVTGKSAAQIDAMLTTEREVYGKVIEATGIRKDEMN